MIIEFAGVPKVISEVDGLISAAAAKLLSSIERKENENLSGNKM